MHQPPATDGAAEDGGANVPSATLERLVSGMPKRALKCAALSGENIDMKYKKTEEV